MSTTAPAPVETAPTGQASGSSSEADRLIEERIVEACRALWWSELTRAALKLVIAILGIVLLWVVVDQWIYSPGMALRAVILTILVSIALWYLATKLLPLFRRSIRPEYAARALERDSPELRQSLTSYVSLRDDREGARLRHRVVRSIGAATAGHLKSHDELPSEAAGTFRWWIATAIALALLMAYAVASPKSSLQSAARLAAPLASIDPAMRVLIEDVQPGNAEAVAGRSVTVSAKVDGLRADEEVFLRWRRAGFNQQTILQRDPETRRYVGELPLAHNDRGLIPYTVEAGDGIAGPFELTVQDVPVVAIQSIHYTPPKYTGQAAWTGSGGAIQALDGTQVKILATTNRPIVKAKIEFNPRPLGASVQATAGASEMEIGSDGTSLSVAFSLRSARGRSAAVELESYRMSVWDSADQRNPQPIIYPIRVIADLPPEVAIMLPTRSPKDLPIDSQQVIEIHASDPDFGLQQISLEVRSGIDLIEQPVLWNDEAGVKGNRIAEYRLRPSEHGLRIGDTVSVVAVATDNRILEHDRSVEPNTSRTDPIELKIVASQPPPRADDPEADGVSAPDDRPASEQGEQESGSGSQEGQQQGGSGGEGQSQQQSGDQQSGDQQGGDSQGDSKAGDQGSGDQGSSDQASSDQGDSDNDPSGSGSSDPSDSDSSDSPESSHSDPSQADPSSGDQSQPGDPTGKPSQQNPDQAGAKPSEQSQGTPPEATQGDNTHQQAGDTSSGDQSSGTDANQNQPEGKGQQQSGQSAEDQSDQSNGGESPQHDGEAFERIREHLEKKRQQQDRNQPSESKQQPGGEQQQDRQSQTSDGESKQQTGDQQPADQASGNQSDSPQSATEQESSAQQGTEGESPEQAEGEQGTPGESPDAGQGDESQSGDSGDQQQRGDSGQSGESATQESGQQESGEQTDAEQSEGGDREGTEGQAGKKPGEGKPGEQQGTGQESPASKPTDGPSGDTSQSNQSGDPADQSPSKPTQSQSSESSNDPGLGGEGESKGGDAGLPPEEANPEFAKKATDMVLDYLKETRDKPDRELLDKLNWSEEDLKRFADRWQKVRDIADRTSDPKAKRELNEALKSLGMRPKSADSSSNIRESADTLRSIRDSGNRKPPPAAYRDAFDAFRRAAGRNK